MSRVNTQCTRVTWKKEKICGILEPKKTRERTKVFLLEIPELAFETHTQKESVITSEAEKSHIQMFS